MVQRLKSIFFGLFLFIANMSAIWAQPHAAMQNPASPFFPMDPPLILSAPSAENQITNGKSGKYDLATSAFFTGEPRSINHGLVWRIYKSDPVTHELTLLVQSSEATPIFELENGDYIIHVAYGFAGASRKVSIGNGPAVERFSIDAGALRLRGSVSDTPIPANMIQFSIFIPFADNSEGKLVLGNVKQNELIRLPSGLYHIVSNYGDANAIMRADIRIESGELTEAVINHRAATVTLKLVSAPGGEAYAGTVFSVLTPGGDTVREVTGAFPSITLSEGEYTLLARHEGEIYSRQFMVEAGLHRDIEILTSQVQPQLEADPNASIRQ
jgi:hypothetical protein